MNHPPLPTCGKFSEEELLLYGYGELPAREAETLSRHLSACALCRGEVEGIKAVRAAVAEPILRDNPLPLTEAKLRVLARENPVKKPGSAERLSAWLFQPRLVYAAGAVALLLILGLSWRYRASHRVRPQDFSNQGLLALVQEVNRWQAPPLAAVGSRTALISELESEIGEAAGEESDETEAGYLGVTRPNGLEDIEQGLEELASTVRYL